jgi:hypothetical protein
MFRGNTDVQNMMVMNQEAQRLGQTGTYGTGSMLGRLKPRMPTNMHVSGTSTDPTVTNSYLGAFTADGNDTTYTMSTANYPSGACADLVTTLHTQDPNAVITAGGQSFAASSTPVDQNAVGKACNASDSNTVSWSSQP